MATHLREDASISFVADTCDAIAAALQSDSATETLAPRWVTLTARADRLAAEHRTIRRRLRRVRARLHVADARWDGEEAAFGRAVVDQSDGKRDTPLYARFFAEAPPSKVQTFGVDREITIAERQLEELGREPESSLAKTFVPRIAAATNALRTASQDRKDALLAQATHDTSVMLLIDDINRELDRTEGDLLKLFPGDRSRVASYLMATRPERRGKRRGDDDRDDDPE